MTTCTGPQCGRTAIAKGLCASHLRQQQRGRLLTPLRTGPRGVVVSTRVPKDVHDALGEAPGSLAREVLTSWARKTDLPDPRAPQSARKRAEGGAPRRSRGKAR